IASVEAREIQPRVVRAGIVRRRWRLGRVGVIATEHADNGVAEKHAARDAERGLRRTGQKARAAALLATRGFLDIAPRAAALRRRRRLGSLTGRGTIIAKNAVDEAAP